MCFRPRKFSAIWMYTWLCYWLSDIRYPFEGFLFNWFSVSLLKVLLFMLMVEIITFKTIKTYVKILTFPTVIFYPFYWLYFTNVTPISKKNVCISLFIFFILFVFLLRFRALWCCKTKTLLLLNFWRSENIFGGNNFIIKISWAKKTIYLKSNPRNYIFNLAFGLNISVAARKGRVRIVIIFEVMGNRRVFMM